MILQKPYIEIMWIVAGLLWSLNFILFTLFCRAFIKFIDDIKTKKGRI